MVGVLYLGVVTALLGDGIIRTLAKGSTPAAAELCPIVATQNPATAPAPDTATTAPPPEAKRATLAPLGTPVESVAFERSIATQDREFEFNVSDEGDTLEDDATCLQVHVNPFLRIGAGGSAQLDRLRMVADASLTGNQARVSLTIARTDVDFAPPGTYSGTVSIVDPRVERVDIPLTVTMSYPIWQLPLVVLLLMLPVAIVNLWLIKGSFSGGTTWVTLGGFRNYVFSRNGILAIGAGIAASVLAWSATYLDSPTWGTTFTDAITLFGAAFAAFTTAATPVTAAGMDRSDPNAKQT